RLSAGDAGLVGDVAEGAIAVVLVEGVLQRLVRLVEICRAAVDQGDVGSTVVFEITEREAGPHRLPQGPGGRQRVLVHPPDAARLSWNLFEDRRYSDYAPIKR